MSFLYFLIFLLICVALSRILFFFFFNDTATTEIYTLSLHDALPISTRLPASNRICPSPAERCRVPCVTSTGPASVTSPLDLDRKSTRLNSSHDQISYAVFCLKKKKQTTTHLTHPKHTHVSHIIYVRT